MQLELMLRFLSSIFTAELFILFYFTFLMSAPLFGLSSKHKKGCTCTHGGKRTQKKQNKMKTITVTYKHGFKPCKFKMFKAAFNLASVAISTVLSNVLCKSEFFSCGIGQSQYSVIKITRLSSKK